MKNKMYLKSSILKTKRGSGSRAAGGQWGFGGETPNAAAILKLFFKKYVFLGIFGLDFAFFNG